MNKRFWALLALTVNLCACMEMNDPSTLIIDDAGMMHHTTHYLSDKRGRDYFPEKVAPSGHRKFVFDPKAYAWAAYDAEGRRLLTGSASGGMDFCNDVGKPCRTFTGTFHVYKKGGPDCRSREYPIEEGGAKMPYCMYFYRGYTIHAGYDIGYKNASHGCIRVLPSAAKWLNERFIKIGTEVIVLSYTDENGNDKV